MNLRWKIAQSCEAFWWVLYLKKKPVTEYISWKKKYWLQFLESHNVSVSGKDKILDAGCGPAGIFMLFSDNKVHAIDPLLEVYRKQINHFQEYKYHHVTFENTGLENFNKIQEYEKAFCLNAINHVADLNRSLKNLCRSLKKDGLLYLSVDAHNHAFFKKIFRLIPGDILHPHQADLGEYKELVIKNGMEIQRENLIKKGFIFNYYLLIGKKI